MGQRVAASHRRTATVSSGAGSGVRPEIQGLRAIAVMMVVLYHLWPSLVPGGFAGVDAFFVISGFLITAHLLRDVTSGRQVKLGAFWARRARRLLPAAYVVLAATALAMLAWVPGLRWEQTFREIIASTLYFENWQLAGDAVDYLAADEPPSAVQHYWSLSVEEQFYLVWPLLIVIAVVLASRLRRSRLAVATLVLALVTVSSFAYSLWVTSHNPAAAYFVTPARAWQFGVGGLLAAWFAHPSTVVRTPRAERLLAVLSWLGVAALAYAAFGFDGSVAWPGTAALVPVAGVLAVIAAGSPVTGLSTAVLFAGKPVQYLGDISYSIYLWHWPPIIIAPFVLGHDLNNVERIVILIAIIPLSGLTKVLIEDPVRRGKGFGLRRSPVTFAVAAITAAVLTVGCLAALDANARQVRQEERQAREAAGPAGSKCFGAASVDKKLDCDPAEFAGVLIPAPNAANQDSGQLARNCWANQNESELESCVFGKESDDDIPRVALIGDSKMRSLAPAFIALANENRIVVETFAKTNCSWSSRKMKHSLPITVTTCTAWRKKLSTMLEKRKDEFDFVVTTSRAGSQPGPADKRADDFAEAWSEVAGAPIVAVVDNPGHPEAPNECLAVTEPEDWKECGISRSDGLAAFDAQPDAVKMTKKAHLMDLTKFYCDEDFCPSVIGGANVYRDRDHPMSNYVKTLTPYIEYRLIKMGLLDKRK